MKGDYLAYRHWLGEAVGRMMMSLGRRYVSYFNNAIGVRLDLFFYRYLRETEMLRAVVTVVVGLLGCGMASAETAKPVTIETLFDYPHYGKAELSPNTKLLAAVAKVGDRMRLIVIDLETQKAKVVAAFDDADIVQFVWVNDKRLVFSIADLGGTEDDQVGGGLFAVDADGAAPRELVPVERKQAERLVANMKSKVYLARVRGTDDILAIETQMGKEGVYIVRLNTRTGRQSYEVTGIAGDITGGV